MKTSEKILSALVTAAAALAFVSLAAWVALHYNAWFAEKAADDVPAVSGSEITGSRVLLNMPQQEMNTGISDEALGERNLYGFPTGDSPYFIYVEKGGHTLSVFGRDDYGLYTRRLHTWSTATGNTALLTPVGTFSVGAKIEWYVWPAGTFSPYATRYYERDNHYGGLFIHGPIYRRKSFDSVYSNSVRNIGTNCSSGCLRTEVAAAYFIYEMCPEGTMVRIVEGTPLGFTPDRPVYYTNQVTRPSTETFGDTASAPDKIEFTEESVSLSVGEQYNPVIKVFPEDAAYPELVWTTNNPSIIKISGESIWAVSAGYAIIIASSKDDSLSASMLINVALQDVDMSKPPPDVGGRTTENNSNITGDYVPISESLIYLRINGENFAINQSVKPLLASLGPNFTQKQPMQSCAYNGLDRFFSYRYPRGGSCEISTVPMLADGGDAVCEIEFRQYTTADLRSSKGIRLGDSMYDVVRAYGSFYTEVVVEDRNNPDNSFTRITYWAGKPNDPAVPSLYFTLDTSTKIVKGMGIYSARNMG